MLQNAFDMYEFWTNGKCTHRTSRTAIARSPSNWGRCRSGGALIWCQRDDAYARPTCSKLEHGQAGHRYRSQMRANRAQTQRIMPRATVLDLSIRHGRACCGHIADLLLLWGAYDRQEAALGLLDVLNGMQNGPRGQRQPGSGGMSPMTMALIGPARLQGAQELRRTSAPHRVRARLAACRCRAIPPPTHGRRAWRARRSAQGRIGRPAAGGARPARC